MRTKALVPAIDCKLCVLFPRAISHVVDRQDESMANDKQFAKEEQLCKWAHNLAELQVRKEVTF